MIGHLTLFDFKRIGLWGHSSQRKSSSIPPYFHGGNLVAFLVSCVITNKTLFSPSFPYKNIAKGCPIFMAKIWQSFVFGVLWCTNRVSCLCIWHALVCSYWGKSRLTKALNTLTHVAYTRKLMSLADMDRRQSHHDNHVQNVVWVCIYNISLGCIPTLQG